MVMARRAGDSHHAGGERAEDEVGHAAEETCQIAQLLRAGGKGRRRKGACPKVPNRLGVGAPALTGKQMAASVQMLATHCRQLLKRCEQTSPSALSRRRSARRCSTDNQAAVARVGADALLVHEVETRARNRAAGAAHGLRARTRPSGDQ